MLFLNLFKEFIPDVCLKCGTKVVGNGICPDCWSLIRWGSLIRCSKCCKQLPYNLGQKTMCIPCENKRSYLDGMDIVMQYNEDIKGIILRLKNTPDFRVVSWLSNLMITSLTETGFDYITPVPLHFLRRIWRGYNQAAQLAREISNGLNIQYNDLLVKTKWTRSQGKFDGVARQKNVEGVFQIKNGIEIIGKSILIIDDVCTTGSTLESVSKTLKKGGASRVWALVAAKT